MRRIRNSNNQMNIVKLKLELERLPQAIRDCGHSFIEARDKAEKEKLSLSIAMSTAMLKAERPNATEKKAYAIIATQAYHKRYLKAQLEEEKTRIELQYVQDQYITVRKLASLEEKMMSSNISGN